MSSSYRQPDNTVKMEDQFAAMKERAEEAEAQLKRRQELDSSSLRVALRLALTVVFLPLAAWACYACAMLAQQNKLEGVGQVLSVVTIAIPAAVGFIAYLFKRYG